MPIQLKSNIKTGLILVSIFIAVRAFATPTYKYLTGSLHPFMIDTYIALVGLVLFGFILGWQAPKFAALKSNKKWDYLKLTAIGTAGALMLDLAIFYLPVKSFSTFVSFLPIIVGFYSGFLLKEKPSKMLWLAAALATAGAIVFKGSGFNFGVGDLLIILGVLLFAAIPIVNRKYIHEIGEKEIMFIGNALYLVPSAILAIVLGVVALPPASLHYNLIFVFSLFALFNVASLLAISVVRHLSAHTFVTLTTALVPIGAIAISIITLGETVGLHEIIGGAVMVGAAVLAAWYSNNQQ